jgi:hypothetical protein
MLSASAREWPASGQWVLQAAWDGLRLLVDVDVDAHGQVRGWSRHGTSLTWRLASLLELFEGVAPGTTFDGELVALSRRNRRPTQDFSAVTRAIGSDRSLPSAPRWQRTRRSLHSGSRGASSSALTRRTASGGTSHGSSTRRDSRRTVRWCRCGRIVTGAGMRSATLAIAVCGHSPMQARRS